MAAEKKSPGGSFRQVMAELRKLGTAQNRKIYARHGASEPHFGVSYANLAKLSKKIGLDHPLAQQLWESGNFDARNLASQIADPKLMTSSEFDGWARELDCYPTTDSFVKLVSRSELAAKKARTWRKRKSEWVARCGWMLTASLALREDGLSKSEMKTLVSTVEAEIHGAPNRVRDAMNYALISIGGTHPILTKTALSAADRIGVVEVDHGETGCKTRDARGYIEAMLSRPQGSRKKVAPKKSTKKSSPKK